MRAARALGVGVVFTYHTPTASCVRGTLLRDGRFVGTLSGGLAVPRFAVLPSRRGKH